MKIFFGIAGFLVAVSITLLCIYFFVIGLIPKLFPGDSLTQGIVGSVLTLFLVPITGIVGGVISVRKIYPRFHSASDDNG